ncbi:glycosyltransferase [Peribacillus frigoritolerans]|uniref:glycosyltransferase n=1 Tax=Peribacillus frigoritolerans TaxID=450367 RepID=UPI003D0055DC
MKYNVTMFIPSMTGGGAERIVANLLNNFDPNFYNLSLVVLKSGTSYQLPRYVKVDVLRSNNLKSVLPELINYFKNNKIDLLISHMSLTNIVALLAMRTSKRKFPIIAVEHSTASIKYKSEGAIRRFIPMLMKFTYRWAERIVCVSKASSQDLTSILKFENNKILTIYNPVVSDEIIKKKNEDVHHKWLDNTNLKVIIGIGRFEKVKNFPLLIDSFNKVYETNNKTRLLILGEGKERQVLEEKIADLHLEEVIDMPGFVSNPYAYLGKASLFVLSSNFEGLPTVIIESLACGTPIVSTDCPSGPREILNNGEYGKIVPVNNVEALAQAILEQLNTKHNNKRLEDRANDFTIEKSVSNYNELIKSILEKEIR